MTYFSSRLIEYPQTLSREQLEHYSLPCRTLSSLAGLDERFGPYDLAGWAKSLGLEVYYVDNCWVRVPLNGLQLRQFCIDHMPTPSDSLLASIVEDVMYLLEAEEF